MTSLALTTRFLMRRDPDLLERRIRGGPTAERRVTQKFIMAAISVGFLEELVYVQLVSCVLPSMLVLCNLEVA